MKLYERINKCVMEALEVDKSISMVEELMGLGMDSLSTVKLVILLEDEFNIKFNDDELFYENFSTIKKIEMLVNDRVEEEN
ncbi:acyl carrier protein [Oceanobacillus sp. 1P07AA]|uniref:acyl carrier protein n=1 Tax=Oceanobacillus sp. 1P07AA TaxID=3132293 RepID=UPI0039A71BFA